MKKLLVLVALISSIGCGQKEDPDFIYRGGDQVGNGGKAVVCRNADQSIASIEILDFYEGRLRYGRHSQIDGNHPASEVLRLIHPLSRLDESRHIRYSRYLEDFYANARFMASPLSITNDSEELNKPPKGCEIEQVVIQIEPKFADDRRYNINQDLWNAMDIPNRTGMILHEIIYYEAIAQGHHNSISARYFTAYIASGALASVDQKNYRDLLAMAELDLFNFTLEEKHFSLIQTIRADWWKGQRACGFFGLGTLVAPVQFENMNEILGPLHELDSKLSGFSREFWTDERTSDKGMVTVASPQYQKSTFEFGSRKPETFAQVLCIKGENHE